MPTKDIERLALEQSLDLANARQRIAATGEQLGLTRWTALASGIERRSAGRAQ